MGFAPDFEKLPTHSCDKTGAGDQVFPCTASKQAKVHPSTSQNTSQLPHVQGVLGVETRASLAATPRGSHL